MEERLPAVHRPPTLVGAAVLVGLEGLLFAGLAALELISLSGARVALGLTTSMFFLAIAAGLLLCARGLLRAQSWARSPVVATQLIGLLLAYSFWGSATRIAALVILGVSAAILVAVLHPASTRALAAEDDSP
jgi:hypothetical protein